MSKHVVLGGGWSSKMRFLQSVKRSGISADAAANNRGFRLLQEDAGDSSHALRGGSWCSNPGRVRSAYRARNAPDSWFWGLGFRLVQEVRDD